MERVARKLECEAHGVKSLEQVAELAGYSNLSSVYGAVNAGRAVAGHVWRWVRDPGDDPPAAEPVPLKGVIVCTCPKCNGMEWKPEQIRLQFPIESRGYVNRRTISSLNIATGHQFEYRTSRGPGNWVGRNGDPRPDWLPDGVRRNWVPSPGAPVVTPLGGNASELARETYPINPLGPGLLFAAWGIPAGVGAMAACAAEWRRDRSERNA